MVVDRAFAAVVQGDPPPVAVTMTASPQVVVRYAAPPTPQESDKMTASRHGWQSNANMHGKQQPRAPAHGDSCLYIALAGADPRPTFSRGHSDAAATLRLQPGLAPGDARSHQLAGDAARLRCQSLDPGLDHSRALLPRQLLALTVCRLD